MKKEECWCLFEKQAFVNGDHTPLPEFKTIGEDIVKKCNGLPLAIITIAGVLSPETDIKVWQDILSSEDWDAKGNILPALWLSYKHLPSLLKGCFAFCALFHKDVPFDKDEVVLLWMANDLVKPSTQKVGRVYFEELKSRSFFESVDGKLYLMHDLINDLARSVAGNTCIRLEDYQTTNQQRSIQRENELPPELLRFSYLSAHHETVDGFSGLGQAPSLRTFLPFNQSHYVHFVTTNFFSDMCTRFQRLRVLNLSWYYNISMVPDSIGDLKHLRLLNLASTDIEKLPNAISKCLNLQTLILAKCTRLVEFPEEMRLLINLQHLDVRGVGKSLITKMATWLNIFKDILVQNISIVVDKIHGSVLEHLDILQPCHSLEILLETDVVTTEGTRREELKDKDCIENLSLEWSGNVESSEDELNKFSKLEPHTNIKQLTIKGYDGTRIPDWLGNSAFSNMEFLSLEDCKNYFSLPPLGQLTGLKTLHISGMDGIIEIGEEFNGYASKPFQALEVLNFRDMAGWAIWNLHSVVFPSLKSLEIRNCKNIMYISEGGLAAPNLKRLWVDNCKRIKSLPARMHTQLPLLSSLTIGYCPEIECFPEGGLPSNLETLHIWKCSKMRICPTNWGLQSLKNVDLSGFNDTLFPEEGLFPTSLQSLYISEFSNMESLNEKGLQHLCYLQTLNIYKCRNLKYLPQEKFSSSLSTVYIMDCEHVESFPEGLASSLSRLEIHKCPKLAARIQRKKGEDWPQVAHIANLSIDNY